MAGPYHALRTTLALVFVGLVVARIEPPSPPESTVLESEASGKPWSFAHQAAHAVLCAATGEGLTAGCDGIPSSSSSKDATTNGSTTYTTTPPAFIYDQLLTANLVLSTTSLVRRGNVLSRAGIVNELNITDENENEKRSGSPILVPNANATRVIVQAASGIGQLQGISSAFLAFTPEWAAARAAFANVSAAEGANIAEQSDESGAGVLSGRKRRRALLMKNTEHGASETSRRRLLATESARNFDTLEKTHLKNPLTELVATATPTAMQYVTSILERVKSGSLNETNVGDEVFVLRKGGADIKSVVTSDFLTAFTSGIDDEGFDVLYDSLRNRNTEMYASNQTESNDSEEQKRNARVADILRQLRDIEPKLDFEISLIVRPIVTTLFWGYASRTWNHKAIRLAPEEITPYTYSDPLQLVAADLYPEVANAYVESLRLKNITDADILQKLLSAVNVRFVVTVAVITRQQISIGGGDILRNVFTLTL